MTWFEAKDHCQRKGAKLVEIDSEEENTALAEKIKNGHYTAHRAVVRSVSSY